MSINKIQKTLTVLAHFLLLINKFLNEMFHVRDVPNSNNNNNLKKKIQNTSRFCSFVYKFK